MDVQKLKIANNLFEEIETLQKQVEAFPLLRKKCDNFWLSISNHTDGDVGNIDITNTGIADELLETIFEFIQTKLQEKQEQFDAL